MNPQKSTSVYFLNLHTALYNPLRVLFKTQRCFKNSFIFIYCFKINPLFLCFDKISDFCCSTLFLLIQKVRSVKKNLIILLLYLLIYLFSCMVSRVHCFMWFSYPILFFLSHSLVRRSSLCYFPLEQYGFRKLFSVFIAAGGIILVFYGFVFGSHVFYLRLD